MDSRFLPKGFFSFISVSLASLFSVMHRQTLCLHHGTAAAAAKVFLSLFFFCSNSFLGKRAATLFFFPSPLSFKRQSTDVWYGTWEGGGGRKGGKQSTTSHREEEEEEENFTLNTLLLESHNSPSPLNCQAVKFHFSFSPPLSLYPTANSFFSRLLFPFVCVLSCELVAAAARGKKIVIHSSLHRKHAVPLSSFFAFSQYAATCADREKYARR